MRREEVERGRRIEVPDVRAEQQHEHRAARRPRRGGAAQADFVGRLMADDGEVLQAASSRCSVCSSACDEMSIEVHARGAAPRPAALRRASPASRRCRTRARRSSTCRRRRAPRRSPRACAAEQPVLGARDPIPRQPADRLEQARPERVVQVLRLQLLRREREIAPHVGGEFGGEAIGVVVDQLRCGLSVRHRAQRLGSRE